MTRFEKLKEMTADEIADWWYENIDCGGCPLCDDCRTDTIHSCPDEVKAFLNSEMKAVPEVCAINLEGEEP